MQLCGFDLETPQEIAAYGLQPWRARTGEATIKTVAVWLNSTSFKSVRMPSKEWFKTFLEWAAKNKVTLVGWNLLFDIAWLHAIGLTKEVNACTWIDAMLLLKRIDGWRSRDLGGRGYSLKDVVAQRWPEHADYGLGEDVAKVPSTEEQWTRLLEYNTLDSKFTCLLAQEYLNKLTDPEKKAARHEALGISPVALSYINGITINPDALAALDRDVAVRREAAEAKLGVPNDIIASPKKLATLLFDTWGLGVVKTTPAGAASTDKETLLTLELEHPDDERLGALMALRKVNTQQSKFVDAVKATVAYHGTLITRPNPFIAGTYSGRMTYSSKQTVPAPKRIKKIKESGD